MRTVSLRVGGHGGWHRGEGLGENVPCSSVCGVNWRISEVVTKVGVRVRGKMSLVPLVADEDSVLKS